MLDFNDLVEDEKEVTKVAIKKPPVPSLISSKVDLSGLRSKKLSKEELDELKKVEPGHKIPTNDGIIYTNVGTWCDHCEDVAAHCLNKQNLTLACLKCKKRRKIKSK